MTLSFQIPILSIYANILISCKILNVDKIAPTFQNLLMMFIRYSINKVIKANTYL
nr:MAG TPA: hypothetical protein [Caudoviricetes sp.]